MYVRTRSDFLDTFRNICLKYGDNTTQYYVSLVPRTQMSIKFKDLDSFSSEFATFLLATCVGHDAPLVGVSLEEYKWLVCIIVSIWKCGFGFVGLTKNGNDLKVLNVRFIVSDGEVADCILVKEFLINEDSLAIYKVVGLSKDNTEYGDGWDMCYGISTSGSTGAPKFVQVPWSCIMPNIEELCTEFQTGESDNVFLSSPYSFDPIFVELFMALTTGAALTVVSKDLKLNRSSLLDLLFKTGTVGTNITIAKHDNSVKKSPCVASFSCQITKVANIPCVTILQTTPTLFKLWKSTDIANSVLSANSKLKILLLGGEKFPSQIMSLKEKRNTTRIFNIYGITEVSCWALIHEVNDSVHEPDIPLGKPLTGINVELVESNHGLELFIKSSLRKCVVGCESLREENDVIRRSTGDLVQCKRDNIFYVSRTDEVKKKFGVKINLKEIEDLFMRSCPFLLDCACVFEETFHANALFVKTQKTHEDDLHIIPNMEDLIRVNGMLPDIKQVDYFIAMRETYINANGKCDKKLLGEILRSECQQKISKATYSQNNFERIWNEVLNITPDRGRGNSFTDLGGTSVKALQIFEKMQELGYAMEPNFITVLLQNGSFQECKKLIHRGTNTPKRQKLSELETDMSIITIKWRFGFRKCVDASPTIIETERKTLVMVGSHSSEFAAVDLQGSIIWLTTLGDRIESGACSLQDGSLVFVGCYDGYLYCLRSVDGSVVWRYHTKEMIKSTPCLNKAGRTMLVASYDGHVYSITAESGELVGCLRLSSGGIYSSPVFSVVTNTFFIGCLDGSCYSISENAREVIWRHKLGSPVFSSPKVVNDNTVVFGEVSGAVHCISAESGAMLWNFQCTGNLYSSFVTSGNRLVFGCHDNHLYCLNDVGNMQWKTPLGSTIYSTPCFYETFVVAATTKGYLYICDAASGSIRSSLQLGGEVFSSPRVYKQNIIIGCRDNHLYCTEIEQQN